MTTATDPHPHHRRRLTTGETVEIALAELRALPHLGDAEVALLEYDEVSQMAIRSQDLRQRRGLDGTLYGPAEDQPRKLGPVEVCPPRARSWHRRAKCASTA